MKDLEPNKDISVVQETLGPQLDLILRAVGIDSSLAKLVLTAQMAKELTAEQTTPLLTPQAMALIRLASDQDLILAAVKRDPNYLALETAVMAKTEGSFYDESSKALLNRFARSSLDAYANFLAGDATPGGKYYATTPQFRSYIEEIIKEPAVPGPVFQRVLSAIGTGDHTIIKFVNESAAVLAEMDYTYFWLEDRFGEATLAKSRARIEKLKKDHPEFPAIHNQEQAGLDYKENCGGSALVGFNEVTGQLLDMIFDPTDQSVLRKFALDNYVAFNSVCSPFNIEKYAPIQDLERINRLVKSVSEVFWFDLAIYLHFSNYRQDDKWIKQIDWEIESGDFSRAEYFASYNITLKTGRQLYGWHGQHEVENHWFNQYMSGAISPDKLMQAASNLNAVSLAYNELPDALRSQVNTTILTSSDLLTEGDKIAKIISSGLDFDMMWSRTKAKPDDLDRLVDYAQSMFFLADDPFGKAGVIISSWVDQYMQGEVSFEALQTIKARLVKLKEAEKAFIGKGKLQPKERGIIRQALKNDFYMPQLLDRTVDRGAAAALLEAQIYPTDELIKAVSKGHLSELAELKIKTEHGHFDPTNILQRDLEFGKYLILTAEEKPLVYQRFKKLTTVDQDREKDLSWQEQKEAEAAAFEAAQLYWLIAQRRERGREVVVVGNNRYGELFAVNPLKFHLQEIGARSCAYRVSSGLVGTGLPENIGSPRNLFEDQPDLVFVDGTREIFKKGNTRFPRAMTGYLNLMLAYNLAIGIEDPQFKDHLAKLRQSNDFNQMVGSLKVLKPTRPYQLSHYLPIPSDLVDFNELTMTYREPGFDEPEAIFASPVIDPEKYPLFPKELSSHVPAWLDDPESNVASREKYAFTPNGLAKLFVGKTQEEFIALIQDHMERVLPDFIRRTNPDFN